MRNKNIFSFKLRTAMTNDHFSTKNCNVYEHLNIFLFIIYPKCIFSFLFVCIKFDKNKLHCIDKQMAVDRSIARDNKRPTNKKYYYLIRISGFWSRLYFFKIGINLILNVVVHSFKSYDTKDTDTQTCF